jgi:hypothetical protein
MDLWPPRSSLLNNCDFYLWGKLKSVVYANNSHDLDALKENIREAIYDIQQCELQQVSRNLFKGIHTFRISSTMVSHSRSWALLEKPLIVQLLKDFPEFYGTWRFITVFTKALHWSLLWATSIQSIRPQSVSLRCILISSPYLRLSVFFWLPHQHPTRIRHLPHSCYMPCPSHPPWLDHCNYTWRRVQVMKFLISTMVSVIFITIFD